MGFVRFLVDVVSLPLTGMPLGSMCSDDPNDDTLNDIEKVVDKLTGG